MTQLYLDGREVVVTAIEAGPCFVSQVKTEKKDGYNAIQLCFGQGKRLNKAEKGHLGDVGMFRNLREFRMNDVGPYEVGQQVSVEMLQSGDRVNVIGVSKGKGFAGGMKRHGFKGGPKTHGQSDRSRAPGSIGAGSTPGRVWKGLRMAGHLGSQRVTMRNLEVVSVDAEKHLLLVKGAVPGAKTGLLLIHKVSKG